MSGLGYVGKPASAANEVPNRLVTNTLLSSATPNASSTQAQINALTSGASPTYAPKTYVDSQDATFSSPSYVASQDALNVPNSSVGVANGVASLVSGLIPAPQMPVLGAGYIQGPYGITSFTAGSASNTPVKIADWNIGAISLSFQPLVFMECFVLGTMGHPVIEVRIANSTTAVSYASSTLVAQGVGRGLYNDYSSVVVLPCPATTGASPVILGPTYNVWLSAWMYDLNANGVTISTGGVATGTAFLLRQAQ